MYHQSLLLYITSFSTFFFCLSDKASQLNESLRKNKLVLSWSFPSSCLCKHVNSYFVSFPASVNIWFYLQWLPEYTWILHFLLLVITHFCLCIYFAVYSLVAFTLLTYALFVFMFIFRICTTFFVHMVFFLKLKSIKLQKKYNTKKTFTEYFQKFVWPEADH